MKREWWEIRRGLLGKVRGNDWSGCQGSEKK